MALVYVTFTSAEAGRNDFIPVEKGSRARTEELTAGSLTTGSLKTAASAIRGDTVVSLYSDANVWIAIGPSATVTAEAYSVTTGPANSRILIAGVREQFSVDEGDAVAALEA